MAKKIQGITIEIDGDTSKLNKAIRGLNAPINAVNNELKNLNQALKLNPNNTELLAQKQEVLKRSIEETTNKLNVLKDAQAQFGSYASLTDQQKASYNRLSLEIAKSESSLQQMNGELKGINKIDLSKVKGTLGKVGNVALSVVKKIAEITAVVSGAMVSVVGLGVKSYAQLEQNIGGINKLFGDNAKDLIENSKKAFESAGLSANQYMETATSFSASLLKGLGGDTQKAVGLTDRAIRDMSDNANTFGTSMEEVMNVYKALSKEQFSTLDNLRLGYAGTKKGMQELIKDASTYTDIQEEMGVAVDSSSMSFDNIINAISVMQKHLNITGTTMNEAKGTITGSLNAMKGAFDNFINGMGSPEQLATTINTFLGQVVEAITKLAPSILLGIADLIETLIPQLATMLFDLLPQLLRAITNLINKMFDMVSKNTTAIRNAITKMINNVVLFITNNLPTILELGLLLITTLATGIADSIPQLLPVIVDCIFNMVNTIIDNLDLIIGSAVEIILALAQGLIDALPKLLQRLPEIITNLVLALTKPEMLAKIIEGAITLMYALNVGLIKAIPELVKATPRIIKGLVDGFKKMITETDWKALGKNILNGILNGMINFGNVVKNAIKKVGNKITSSIKSFFGIKSPSRLMQKEVGENLIAGIGRGFEKGIPQTIREVNSAMTNLNNGIESSLNPTINPSANTNPLIIQIENFNNTRQQDVQALAEELEFYRKNSALARGGN